MKTPLVFLPGMMCDARLFDPQVADIFDRSVMVLPISDYDNVANLAQDILKNAPDYFILGGLSMGGIVAMEVLRQAPERIAGLALFDTNPYAETDEVKQRREPQIQQVRTGDLYAVMKDEMKPHYLVNQAPRLLKLCMDMAMSLGKDVFIRQSRALQQRPDQTKTLQAYQGAALIAYGEGDKLCPAHRHEMMARYMPQADYHVIADSGHLPTLEQPERTNLILKDWLNNL